MLAPLKVANGTGQKACSIFFNYLKKIPKKGGEYQLTDAVQLMIDEGYEVYAYLFKGKRFDTGNKKGFFRTILHYATKDPDLKAVLEEFVKNKDFSGFVETEKAISLKKEAEKKEIFNKRFEFLKKLEEEIRKKFRSLRHYQIGLTEKKKEVFIF